MKQSYYITKDGDLNRRISTGDMRELLVTRGTDPEDLKDPYLRWLTEELYTQKGVILVSVYDEEIQHLGVAFRSERHAEGYTLEFMAEQGFKTTQAGSQSYAYENGEYYNNAYAEFRPDDKSLIRCHDHMSISVS
ncbi:hypothetical protein [Natronorubrum sulfidifaciens]|uniref:Uncharacterized protein n=1 Tax=Natronorubrum sulfidifaciens JCM 14089 TaxID=1230460 RepID=L9WCZ3_9EURY|nr:hypothetical protein [Natronorubrum sulfidifaciens]ELY47334.1 hypothetical protein C495_03712 [Natronorubrum sulfidifaciens JCM 14089]